jgi:predicted heme/steroid binding protein
MFDFMFRALITNIPVLVVSVIATVTGGTAVAKVAQELQTQSKVQARQVVELRDQTPTVTPSVTPDSTIPAEPTLPPQPTLTQPAQTSGRLAVAGTFTLATLATHNISGDCFVAYKGIVYDVSAHPSWQSCTHHGTQGGRDITSVFPHSTSYFSTLPKVGTLPNGSTGTPGSSVPRGSEDDDLEDDEDQEEQEREDEQDDKEEKEVEDEHDED